MRTLFALAFGPVVLAGAACSYSAPTGNQPGPVGGSSTSIEAVGSSACTSNGYGGGTTCRYYFNPVPDTVAVGTAVGFKFDDVAHTVNFDTGPGTLPDSIGTSSGKTTQRTFATAGTYTYHCDLHTYMTGTVVVH
jgi:plastocyanin